MYKKTINPFGGESKSIIRTTDGAFIPFDPANVDYIEYLKWVEEGNTPLPAEDVA